MYKKNRKKKFVFKKPYVVDFSSNFSYLLTNKAAFWLNIKYFLSVKYFWGKKIFLSVWLHYENCFRKCFLVFGCILKMLFSNYFLIFSHQFSQLPNKFYNRKFQYINLKKQKSKQHHWLNSTIRSNWEREEERVIKNWGKGRDRSRVMGDEIGHG